MDEAIKNGGTVSYDRIPIVVSKDKDGAETRMGVFEYRDADGPRNAVTFRIHVGDGRWVEAEVQPEDAKRVSDLILSLPCVAALAARAPSVRQEEIEVEPLRWSEPVFCEGEETVRGGPYSIWFPDAAVDRESFVVYLGDCIDSVGEASTLEEAKSLAEADRRERVLRKLAAVRVCEDEKGNLSLSPDLEDGKPKECIATVRFSPSGDGTSAAGGMHPMGPKQTIVSEVWERLEGPFGIGRNVDRDIVAKGVETAMHVLRKEGIVLMGVECGVKTMKTSSGEDHYVSVACGGRELTPHMFRERWKADYEVAEWRWLLNGAEKPDILAYGPDGPRRPGKGA